ncbi:MAG: FimV/HubP family polar landmark protein [Gammaproteobacteria bacterium]
MRKLALAVAVAMASSRVYALGMGEIELHSALNEPLDADVRLLAARPGELGDAVVSLAPSAQFTQAGIERPAILSDIKFTIVRGKDGTAMVHLTSTQPIREPFLDFIVQLRWQAGLLLREYTLLLDPPVFGAEKQAPVSAPVAETAKMPQTAPVAPVRPPVPAPMHAATPARTATAQPTPQVPAQGGTMVAGGGTLASRVNTGNGKTTYGPTRRTDTLWSLAKALLPDDSVTVYQMMMALLKENPQAFDDNNVNGLKAGYVLRIPDKSVVMSIDGAQAKRQAAQQDARWRQSGGGSATRGTEEAPAPSAKSGQSAQNAAAEGNNKETGRLRLVAPGDVSAKSAGAGAGPQQEIEKLRSQLAIAMESSDSAKREGDELRSRISALEDQIKSMQRLLTLKDETLNELQKRAGTKATETQPPAESTAPSVQVPPVAPGKPAPVKPAAPVKSAPAKPAAPVKPAPAKPAAPVKSAVDKVQALAATIFDKPMLMGAVGGAVLLLLAVLWLVVRRRRNDGGDNPDEAVADEALPPVTDIQDAQEETVAQEESWEIPDAMVAGVGDTQATTEVTEEIAQGQGQGAAQGVEQEVKQEAKQEVQDELPEAAGDLDALHTPEGDIDPIVEADVYLAYRRYQQAEALIQGALATEPGRHDLQAKLLEIYYAAKNADAFQSVAQSLYDNLGANPANAIWQRILPMGRELCPDHSLFAEGASSAAASADQGAGAAGAVVEESLDLNLGGATEGLENTAGLPQEQDTAFDLSLGEDALGGAVSGATEQGAGVGKTPGAANQAPAQEVAAEGNGNNSWEVEPGTSEFGNVDFGLEDSDLLAGTDVVGTKLDLARAYIDMGDNDSARDILTEVIEEGNDQQKQEAKGLVEKIA